jgi:hypothetical protein
MCCDAEERDGEVSRGEARRKEQEDTERLIAAIQLEEQHSEERKRRSKRDADEATLALIRGEEEEKKR